MRNYEVTKMEKQKAMPYGRQGFVAIVTVLMISALVLLVSLSVTVMAISQLQGSLSQTTGEDKWYLTDGCVEDALLKISQSPAYAGGSITRPEGTCKIVLSKTGNVYTLTVNSSSTSYNRTVAVTATRTGTITISNWKEI